jgi:replicative DNA helicase
VIDKLSGSLQENLLCLVCFSDASFQLVRSSVEPTLFTSQVYRDILERVYDYIDRFKKPPKEHLADLLEDVLQQGTPQSELYEQVIVAANGIKDTFNEEYILSQLDTFIRQQRLKVGVVQATQFISEGDLEQAETVLEAALRNHLQLFRPGLTLRGVLKELRTKDDANDVINLGIPELDKRRLGPGRKEIHLFIAPSGRGKSWWLTHITKRAVMQRLRVCVVTLEMSEKMWGGRLLQSLFVITKREGEVLYSKLERDGLGRLIGLDRAKLKKALSFSDDKTFKHVSKKLDSFEGRLDLFIREFPTRSIGIHGLRAYLDSLERTQQFTPDILILDYADLLKIDPKNYRLELGALYQELRGLAVERNMMLATASQANREGAGARIVLDTHTAEDFSKIGTTDFAITYSQTQAEKQLGLARLFVSKARTDEDRFMILITQAYATGQFCLDSIRMVDSYGDLIRAAAGAEEEQDADENKKQ